MVLKCFPLKGKITTRQLFILRSSKIPDKSELKVFYRLIIYCFLNKLPKKVLSTKKLSFETGSIAVQNNFLNYSLKRATFLKKTSFSVLCVWHRVVNFLKAWHLNWQSLNLLYFKLCVGCTDLLLKLKLSENKNWMHLNWVASFYRVVTIRMVQKKYWNCFMVIPRPYNSIGLKENRAERREVVLIV
jgi:hypothetical protein